MWHDQPFSQRNKKTKRAVGVDVAGKGGGGGGGQNLKKGVVGNIGGLETIRQLCTNIDKKKCCPLLSL